MGGKKVKKTNVSVRTHKHTHTHLAILLMSVLEGGLHNASEGLRLD